MDFELLSIGLLFSIGAVFALRGMWSEGVGRLRWLSAGLWTVAFTAIAWAATDYGPREQALAPLTDQPIELNVDGYVSSRACEACHPREYGTWYDSYHRTMTQFASEEAIAAPWDGIEVQARGVDYKLEREGDEFWVEMDDLSHRGGGPAPRVKRRVVQTTGSHESQFYWYASGDGRRLSLLLIYWRLLGEDRWGPLDGCCITPPDSGQESETGRWNRVCNRCHATHVSPRISDEDGDGFYDRWDTHAVELGIACEACHGPGGAHADNYRDPFKRYSAYSAEEGATDIVNPGKLDHERSSEACGQCHGILVFAGDEGRERWRESGFEYTHGESLHDSRDLVMEGDGQFWSDGMIRVSGREYNGLVRTPCFVNGEMSCLSCHGMHQAADDPRPREEWADDQLHPGMRGNLACTQCHKEFDDEAYLTAHSHHAPGSTGSNCYNCHMPYTTYGLLKGIRSHEISSPDVRASVETGRPNACNQCHLDKTMAWAAEGLEDWYGIDKPSLNKEQREVAASILWSLKGDAGQRALMAWSFGWESARLASGTEWSPPFLAALLSDPYHAVRYIAERSLKDLPAAKGLRYDYMMERSGRNAGMMQVLKNWGTKQGATNSRAAPELLIETDGVFNPHAMQQRINQLLSERVDPPLTLNE